MTVRQNVKKALTLALNRTVELENSLLMFYMNENLLRTGICMIRLASRRYFERNNGYIFL